MLNNNISSWQSLLVVEHKMSSEYNVYQHQISLYLPIFQEYQYWIDCTVTCLLRPIKRYNSLPSRFIALNLQLYGNVYIHVHLMLFILVVFKK